MSEDAVTDVSDFVRKSKEMDLAWLDGTLNDWLEKELADELARFRGADSTEGPDEVVAE